MIKQSLIWVVLVLTAIVLISTSACKKENFEPDKEKENISHVKNGDYLIPVLVRGNTTSNKIILYVQGGPGYSSMDFALVDFPEWKNSLEKDYAIAYYDQRGMGNIHGKVSQGDEYLNTWVEDLHAVASFLKNKYRAEVIMMGHSFGGGLLYQYMLKKGATGLAAKYIIANAPVTTDHERDTLRWRFRREFLYNTAILEIGKQKNNAKWDEVLQWLSETPSIKKLEGPNPYELYDKWNVYVEDLIFSEYPEKSISWRSYIKVLFDSPYNPLVSHFLNLNYKDAVASKLLKEEENFNLMAKLDQLKNQNLLLIGSRYDDICPPEELAFIFPRLATPNKVLKIIENAGHSSMNHQPAEFYQIIKQFIQ